MSATATNDAVVDDTVADLSTLYTWQKAAIAAALLDQVLIERDENLMRVATREGGYLIFANGDAAGWLKPAMQYFLSGVEIHSAFTATIDGPPKRPSLSKRVINRFFRR